MKERLLKILEKYNLSSAQFAEMVGVQRSSISHILSGRNKPSYDFLIKIIEHFRDINAEWLLSGKGNMLKTPILNTNRDQSKDLFTPKAEFKPKSPEIKENTSIIHPSENEKKHIESAAENLIQYGNSAGITNVNKVKFIVFVYEDDTFEIINKK